jgi:hypothetical protein
VPRAAIETHLSIIGNPQAMEAALSWYRARGVRRWDRQECQPSSSGATRTTQLDGGRPKGPVNSSQPHYQFEALPGVSHYAADKCRNRLTHRCWHISHGNLLSRRPAERRHTARQDGSDGKRVEPVSMSSRAARRRGEGRSPEPPCLTNDGGMTDYLLLFFEGTSRAMTPYRRNDGGTSRLGGAAAPCWRSNP